MSNILDSFRQQMHDVIERFSSFVWKTSNGQLRQQFPRSDVKVFLAHLNELLGTLCGIGPAFNDVSKFFNMVAITAETLRGETGIVALRIQLECISELITRILEQEQIIRNLFAKNILLQSRIVALEREVADMTSKDQRVNALIDSCSALPISSSARPAAKASPRELIAGDNMSVRESCLHVNSTNRDEIAPPMEASRAHDDANSITRDEMAASRELPPARDDVNRDDIVPSRESSPDDVNSIIRDEIASWFEAVREVSDFHKIDIIRIYIGLRAPGTDHLLVVVYCDKEDRWNPPLSNHIHWQNQAQPAVAKYHVEEVSGYFAEFCALDPNGMMDLFADFFDESCTSLISNRVDVSVIMPAARKDTSGGYEPVFLVSVLAPGIYPACNGPLPTTVTSSSGRSIAIEVTSGLMLEKYSGTIGMGCGISLRGMNDTCGSISAVVCSQGNNNSNLAQTSSGSPQISDYFVTCEHCTAKMIAADGVLYPVMPLVLPSPQARKREIYARMNIPSDMNQLFLRSNESHISDALGLGHSTADDVTLQQLRRFIYEDHTHLVVEKAGIVNFAHRLFELDLDVARKVRVSADIGLIPVDSTTLQATMNFPIHKILKLEEVAALLKCGRTTVKLYGAASLQQTVGQNSACIPNFAHVTDFMTNCYSPTLTAPTAAPLTPLSSVALKFANLGTLGTSRVLFGQFLIEGNQFGLEGDSGGLVALEGINPYTNNTDTLFVGVFGGTIDKNSRSKFVATPAEVLLAGGYALK
jgi:hypothetical protein